MLDDDKSLKQNAARLNTLVQQPKTTAYMEKYHPGESSAVELSDDWNLPFIHKQNSVEFNHTIRSQMDFGFDEI